ncbi:hypothetical protein ZHEEYJVH_CDS0107 [Shigella phage Tf]|nr:hypothetical protein ZHEEYJVH_CDS0107 [Shigella phage Tf]
MQAYWIEILLSLGSVAVFVYLLCKYYAEHKKCDFCNGEGYTRAGCCPICGGSGKMFNK